MLITLNNSNKVVVIPANSTTDTLKDVSGNSLSLNDKGVAVPLGAGNLDIFLGCDKVDTTGISIKVALYYKPNLPTDDQSLVTQAEQPVLDAINGDHVILEKFGRHAYDRSRGGVWIAKINEAKNTTNDDVKVFLNFAS